MSNPGCCKRLREEFRLRNFFLEHEDPQTFVQFQFGWQRAYLVWRIFWACYHVAWIIVSGARSWEWAGHDPSQQVKWFIYLTDWCYFVLTVSTLMDAIVVTYIFFWNDEIRAGRQTRSPWYVRMNWATFTLGSNVSVIVSVAYWALVYEAGSPITAVNVATHMVNAIYVIVNVGVTGVPIRLLHFWYGIFYGIVYSLFSYIYYAAGGTNNDDKPYIYSALDWRDPGNTMLYAVIVSFVLAPVVHMFLFVIHSVKLCIWNSASVDSNEAFKMTDVASGGKRTYEATK